MADGDRHDALSPRTDLAVESFDPRAGVEGVSVERDREPGVDLTRVRVLNQVGAGHVGKPPGTYVTVEAPQLGQRARDLQERVSDVVARELTSLLQVDADAHAFVVGLGNWRATPDALGPRVIEELLVTRHLKSFVPADLRGQLRTVSALAPGVLGITGIETGEIIKGTVDRLEPGAVIVIDALAAHSLDRILTTIQLADTGIHPGSGVGGNRVGITPDSLGVPVVAVGVPTVVHAVTIANQTMDLLQKQLGSAHQLHGLLDGMEEQQKRDLIGKVLSPAVGNLMVTPKEIDVHIEHVAEVVAAGINQALHPGVESTGDLADALRR